MNKATVLTLGLLLVMPIAHAKDKKVAPFQWSRATLELIESGDAERGKEIAKEHKCKKCHGKTGISDEDDTPSIAGQAASYQFKQLVDYATKVRDERSMYKRARKLKLQEMAHLSAFYAAQEPEPAEGKTNPPKLVTEGDMGRLLLPCNVCHGENGEGLGFEVPAISGQKIEHFIETMVAFQEADRENDEYGRMRFIASQLNEKEIEELAAYYAAPRSEEED